MCKKTFKTKLVNLSRALFPETAHNNIVVFVVPKYVW